jgi:hypothetical protein
VIEDSVYKTTKSKAKANNDMLRDEIQRLLEKRVIWQEGAYKRSNEALVQYCSAFYISL